MEGLYLEYTQNHSGIAPNTIFEPKGVLPVTVGKVIQRLFSIYPGTIFSDIPPQMKQTLNSVHQFTVKFQSVTKTEGVDPRKKNSLFRNVCKCDLDHSSVH